MMVREDVYLSTDEDHEQTDWQGTIHFCDAVPVCHANPLSSVKSCMSYDTPHLQATAALSLDMVLTLNY